VPVHTGLNTIIVYVFYPDGSNLTFSKTILRVDYFDTSIISGQSLSTIAVANPSNTATYAVLDTTAVSFQVSIPTYSTMSMNFADTWNIILHFVDTSGYFFYFFKDDPQLYRKDIEGMAYDTLGFTIYQFIVYDTNGNDVGGSSAFFAEKPRLIYLFSPSDGNNVNLQLLEVFFYDNAQVKWMPIHATSNPPTYSVSGEINHFSTYGAFENGRRLKDNLDGLIVYPNPFIPYDGEYQTGTPTTGIYFDNLTAATTIRIYNLAGEKVFEIYVAGDPRYRWDVKTSSGKELASGVYLYHITNSVHNTRVGKIMVIN